MGRERRERKEEVLETDMEQIMFYDDVKMNLK